MLVFYSVVLYVLYVGWGADLLEGIDQIGYGLIRPILDFVPLEGPQVLVHGLCPHVSLPTGSEAPRHSAHTVVYRLLLLQLLLVPLQNGPQAISYLGYDTFACGV